MAWNYLSNLILDSTWQFLNPTEGNLLKLVHVTDIPVNNYYDWRGLLGRVIGNELSDGIGDIRRMYFYPDTQYYLFKALPIELPNRYALRGYWSEQSSYNWYVTAWIWDKVVSDVTTTEITIPELTEIANQNSEQKELINEVINILTNPPQASGNNPNLYI